MIKKFNIVTTKSDLTKIVENGCIICKGNYFKYLSVKDTYVCEKCKSSYAIDNKGIINMLLEIGEIRIYKGRTGLIDDVKVDRIIDTKVIKDNRPKVKKRVSNR